MATQSELYARTGVTIGSSEYSVPNGGTTLQTITTDAVTCCWFDAAAMQKGDQYQFRVYEKVVSGGTQKVIFSAILTGVQSSPLVFPALILMHGWDVTVKKLAGTDRAFDASVRVVTGTNITELYSRSNKTLGTEYSIVNDSTSLASSTTVALIQAFAYDRGNMVKGDEFKMRMYEKVTSGTQRKLLEIPISDVQVSPIVTPAIQVRNGWDVSMAKVSATDRAFDLSIRAVTG